MEGGGMVQVTYVEGEPKRHHSIRATRLVHEHFGTIMSFAYSRLPLQQLVRDKFSGEWKYLHRALFEIPEERAIRALIELGVYIRVIDDDEKLSEYYGDGRIFGALVGLDGSRTPLLLRDVANKIIHAERYEWSIPGGGDPTVECFAGKDQPARGRRTQSIS
jgi:hypothetical protein